MEVLRSKGSWKQQQQYVLGLVHTLTAAVSNLLLMVEETTGESAPSCVCVCVCGTDSPV